MIAYNKQSLDNFEIRSEVEDAMYLRLVSREEAAAIAISYPAKLYRPNVFIQIGLFLATSVVIVMGTGLLLLLLDNVVSRDGAYGSFSVFCGLSCYAALEILLRHRRHFHSGVDDAFLWFGTILLVTGTVLLAENMASSWIFLLVALVALFNALRYVSAFMTVIFYGAFIFFIWHVMQPLGTAAPLAIQLTVFSLSVICYVLARKNKLKHQLRHYRSCITMLEVVALITTYATLNYFVVRELAGQLDASGSATTWLFWSTTFLIPVLYIVRSLQKKDHILLRMGLLLLVASVLTVRYYHPIIQIEYAMILWGGVLTVGMYVVLQYFRQAKRGITTELQDVPGKNIIVHVESLLPTESMPVETTPATQEFKFGGGSGGGGGATGSY